MLFLLSRTKACPQGPIFAALKPSFTSIPAASFLLEAGDRVQFFLRGSRYDRTAAGDRMHQSRRSVDSWAPRGLCTSMP